MNVREEKFRVLLVQAYPSFEFRYLKEMLKRDNTIQLRYLLQEADVDFTHGDFVVAGTDRRISLLDVAGLGRDSGAPLDTYYAWTRE